MISTVKNRPTTDGYSTPGAVVLTCVDATTIDFVVGNAAIYWQRGVGSPPAWDDDEAFLPPTIGSIDVAADAVRVRSATAGVPAQVSITAYQGDAGGSGNGE